MSTQFKLEVGGREITLETGKMARQADGAVYLQMEDTALLATAVTMDDAKEVGFMPLTVNHLEKGYAAGKIPGGFFKREGRPGERETLISRLIDRSIRPLFPEGYRHETQVILSVFSADLENDPDILGIIGASTALHISRIPFNGPIGAVRVGRLEGELRINPTSSQMQESDLNIVVVGTGDSILMVESGAQEVSEEVILEALRLAQGEIAKIVALQEEMKAAVGREKMEFTPKVPDPELAARVERDFSSRIAEAVVVQGKEARSNAMKALKE